MTGRLIDIAAARELVLAAVRPLPAEDVALERALGRVLAEDAAARADVPPFDSSAMDGFAVAAGPAGALAVVGESRAGHPCERRIAEGEAIRISTGAAIPPGTGAVVPIERVEVLERRDGAEARIAVPERVPGANLRRAGEDVRAGERVIAAGTVLGPAEVAVLAALGRDPVRCRMRPRVAVLATGDELVEPSRPLGPGQIHDSNLFALAAQAERAGAAAAGRTVVPDRLEATVEALAAALEAAEVVCVSGGVSVGPHDHVKPALRRLGVDERFWGVALKPGKPTWFGVRGDRLVFGLPGNPVSAMVTFHLFARPALRRLAGADPADSRVRAVLDAPVARNPGRDQVVRCRLEPRDDGFHVVPTKDQGSHVLTSMLGAGAFALIPAGEGEVEAGQRVNAELLARE